MKLALPCDFVSRYIRIIQESILPRQVGQQLPLRRTDLEQVTVGHTWEKQWT